MATAKRPLTVAKVEWTRASKAQIAKGMLGTLKVTIEAEGKFVSFLRDVKVRGKIRGMTKEEERRWNMAEGSDVPWPRSGDLFGTLMVTGLDFPDFTLKALATVKGLQADKKLKEAVSSIVRGKKADTLPKVARVAVILWDPTGLKAEKLQKQVKQVQSKEASEAHDRKKRGPGRNPKKPDFIW